MYCIYSAKRGTIASKVDPADKEQGASVIRTSAPGALGWLEPALKADFPQDDKERIQRPTISIIVANSIISYIKTRYTDG